MGVNARKREGIGVRLDHTRSGRARTPVVLLHHGADRWIPPPEWIGEEINRLPGSFLQLGLAVSDFAFCFFHRQGRQDGMVNAVRAELESLLRKLRDCCQSSRGRGLIPAVSGPGPSLILPQSPVNTKSMADRFNLRMTGAAELAKSAKPSSKVSTTVRSGSGLRSLNALTTSANGATCTLA